MSQQLGAAPPNYGLNPSIHQTRIPQLGSSFPTQTSTSPPRNLPHPYGTSATSHTGATPTTTQLPQHQLSQQQALQYSQRLMTQQMMKGPYAPQTATSPNPLTTPPFNQMSQIQKEQFFQRQQLSRQHQMRQQQLLQAQAQAAAVRAQTNANAAQQQAKVQTTNPFATAAPAPQYVPNPYGSANRNPLQQNQNRLNTLSTTPQQTAATTTTTQQTHPQQTAATNRYLPNTTQTLSGYPRKPYIPNLNATQLPQPQQAPQLPQQTTTAILNGSQQTQPQTQTLTQTVTQQQPQQQQTQQQNVNAGVSTPGTPGTEQSGIDTMSQSSKYNESYNNTQQGFTKQPQYPVLPARKYMNITPTQYNDPLRQIKVVSFNVMPKGADFKNKLQRTDHLVGYRTRPNYFSWGRRGPLLFEEIKRGGADIICLQGCDQFDYFQEKLSPRGFVGVYERTTKPLQMQNVYFGDGLAIFWRTNKFELSGRQKFLLGDNRFISNIALLARLKRRSPFIDPSNMDFLRNPQNIVYESNIKCKAIGGDKSLWCVLSTKYLYLFNDKQHYDSPIKYFDLDTFYQIKNSNSNLNDTSFILYPKQNNNISNMNTMRNSIEFETGDVNKNLMWIKNIKTAQIGIEIDVWNTHLIEGHSMKSEYRRVKQAQVLFECMSRASAQNNLIDKNIGSKYNPYSNNNNYKFYQDVLDKKAANQINNNNTGKTKADLSILSTGIGNYTSKPTQKSMKNSGGGSTDLAERFKKMMEKRIKTSETSKLPVRIDPNIKDNNDHEDDDEKKGNDDIINSRPEIGLSLDAINSNSNNIMSSNGTTKTTQQMQQENDDPPFQVPTQLHRPVILCCDTESNAHGDYDYQIPPLTYTYLTMKSRTTQNNSFFGYSMKTLSQDPATQTDRHSWFLQSAYALGFGQEPEFTSFNRYWPNEAGSKGGNGLTEFGTNNIDSATKRIDFNQSIEVSKCSDFILFSPQHFRVLKLMEPLRKDWIMRKWNKTLPCVDYPSDHTMIGVEFELAVPTMPSTHMMNQNATSSASSSVPITQQQQQPSTPGLIPQTPTTPNMSVGLKTPTTTGLPTPTPSTTTNPATSSLTNIGTSMATTAIPSIHYTPTGSNTSYNSPFANQYTQRAFAAQQMQPFQHK